MFDVHCFLHEISRVGWVERERNPTPTIRCIHGNVGFRSSTQPTVTVRSKSCASVKQPPQCFRAKLPGIAGQSHQSGLQDVTGILRQLFHARHG